MSEHNSELPLSSTMELQSEEDHQSQMVVIIDESNKDEQAEEELEEYEEMEEGNSIQTVSSHSVDPTSVVVVEVDATDKTMEVSADEFFQCAVCRKNFITQVDFFVHLKSHYEPIKRERTFEGISKPKSNLFPKKRGRKPKSIKIEKPEEATIVKQEVPHKTTRSGRISKPKLDLDMVPLSPELKKPKSEPLSDSEDMFDFPEPRVELGDQLDDDDVAKHFLMRRKRGHIIKRRQRRGPPNNVKKVQLEENGPVKYQCEICHKLYANTTSMHVHMRIHNGERPYQCPDCGRAFRQQSDLKYHQISIHSDKKAYQCEFCGKEFSRKYSLTIHQKIHTGIRDYKCDVCQRGFRAAIYLSEHRRIHTGEKPFQCDVCGRGFRIKSDMERHRLNVHFKGRKDGIVVVKGPKEEGEVIDKAVEHDGGMATQFVTIAKDDSEEQTVHRLVFISENEAILV